MLFKAAALGVLGYVGYKYVREIEAAERGGVRRRTAGQ